MNDSAIQDLYRCVLNDLRDKIPRRHYSRPLKSSTGSTKARRAFNGGIQRATLDMSTGLTLWLNGNIDPAALTPRQYAASKVLMEIGLYNEAALRQKSDLPPLLSLIHI